MRQRIVAILTVSMLLVMPALAGDGLMIDEIMVQFPAEFTELLVIDANAFVSSESVAAEVVEPLLAANHPLSGLFRTIDLFRIPAQQVQFAALGQGPEVTSFAYISGPSQAQLFGALQGLNAFAQSPESGYTHGEFGQIGPVPIFSAGGFFGPVAIEWIYIPAEGGLWVGSEVAFQPGVPDVARLQATAEIIVDKLLGASGQMGEVLIGLQVRGGDVGYVRSSTPQERPFEPGEQALGFSMIFTEDGAIVNFAVRFDSAGSAAAAEAGLLDGTSSYLAQDLYQAELVSVVRNQRALNFQVATSRSGVVGLLFLVMPF